MIAQLFILKMHLGSIGTWLQAKALDVIKRPQFGIVLGYQREHWMSTQITCIIQY